MLIKYLDLTYVWSVVTLSICCHGCLVRHVKNIGGGASYGFGAMADYGVHGPLPPPLYRAPMLF